MRRKTGEVVLKMVTIAILSALGFVLMAFVRIPYPLAPWLMIEISDMVVLIAYAMYGLIGGFAVAIIKTVLDLAVYGLIGLGIGNLTALFTSLMFVLALLITSHLFRLFNKGLKYRIIGYVFISLFVSLILTLLNALFITPSYLTVYGDNARFSTCFEEGMIESVIVYFHGQNVMVGYSSYIGLISLIYMPFNLLKSVLCCFVFELVFYRLIVVIFAHDRKMNRYFVSDKNKVKASKTEMK